MTLPSDSSPPLSGTETALIVAIERRRSHLLEDLRFHVGLPTGGLNGPALEQTRDVLTARLSKLGATLVQYPGQPRPDWLYGANRSGDAIPPTVLASRLRPEAALPRVLISGHLDTVHDPLGAFQRLDLAPDKKTAVGPGCVDMKGGLVIAVAALEALDEIGIAANWSFVLNSDEETGSYHSEQALRHAAKSADLALVLEPALPNGGLVVERPGSGQFVVRAGGKSAHVGRDFKLGVSAVTALADRLVALGKMSEPDAGKIVNIGPITGGIATNVVPDSASAWGNVRFQDPAIARQLEAQVLALQTKHDAMPSIEVLTSFNRPAKPLTPATKALANFAAQTARSINQPLPFGSTGGVCDGNILQDAGVPTIDTLGVRGGGLHTPQEWIEIPSLVERCQLLALLIARLSNSEWRRILHPDVPSV